MVICLGVAIGLKENLAVAAVLLLLVIIIGALSLVIDVLMSRRWQFTLKTALVVTTLCAVACALWRCEVDARKRFEETTAAVDRTLSKLLPGLDKELTDRWLRKAQSDAAASSLRTPNGPIVGSQADRSHIALGYFGSSRLWTVARWTPSADSNLSSLRVDGLREARVVVEITCSRPWSLVSRVTTVRIADRGAPDNALLLDPLKAELDRNGMPYTVLADTMPPPDATEH